MKEAIIGERAYIFSNAAEALDFGQYWHHHQFVPMLGNCNYPLFWATVERLTIDVKLSIGLMDSRTYQLLKEQRKYCIEPPRVPKGMFVSVAYKILD